MNFINRLYNLGTVSFGIFFLLVFKPISGAWQGYCQLFSRAAPDSAQGLFSAGVQTLTCSPLNFGSQHQAFCLFFLWGAIPEPAQGFLLALNSRIPAGRFRGMIWGAKD